MNGTNTCKLNYIYLKETNTNLVIIFYTFHLNLFLLIVDTNVQYMYVITHILLLSNEMFTPRHC
jgi:hypothetical protein